jgi:hypothetical protein
MPVGRYVVRAGCAAPEPLHNPIVHVSNTKGRVDATVPTRATLPVFEKFPRHIPHGLSTYIV